MRPLVEKGHVYVAQPPLYKLVVGKETHWARDDKHKQEIKANLRANAKIEETRFKGLGEMDAKELAQTTLNPKQRTLLKVEIDSLLDADTAFRELLGKDVEPRYDFIMRKAAEAENVDV
jgi:DNA gyrase/topoisomerase IV subunit B